MNKTTKTRGKSIWALNEAFAACVALVALTSFGAAETATDCGVKPIAALMAERISKAVSAGDLKARFPVRPEMEGMRRLAKLKPLESLKPTLPRTEDNFRRVLREIETRRYR